MTLLPRTEVPCGSCTRCCKGEAVMLMPEEGDNLASYEHEMADLPFDGRRAILKRKPNGDCVYLGETGCTIYDRAPAICRHFDCRKAYQAFIARFGRAERRRMLAMGAISKEVIEEGRVRLASLDEDAA
jgi:Fe-S-cluster containining protein